MSKLEEVKTLLFQYRSLYIGINERMNKAGDFTEANEADDNFACQICQLFEPQPDKGKEKQMTEKHFEEIPHFNMKHQKPCPNCKGILWKVELPSITRVFGGILVEWGWACLQCGKLWREIEGG